MLSTQVKPKSKLLPLKTKSGAASSLRSYFKLSGNVGGADDFAVAGGAIRRLQVISLHLPANSKLIVSWARFFFSDPEIFLRVSVLDVEVFEIRHWQAESSVGDLRPRVTLLTTTRARDIYLAIAGKNVRTPGESRLHPEDGWWVKFDIVPKS